LPLAQSITQGHIDSSIRSQSFGACSVPDCLLPLDGGPPIVLDANDLVLGRDPGCDFTIRGADTVSRRHCRLTRSGHYFNVHDLDSRNGVRVNGHRIHEPTSLKPGDFLRLGKAEFVLASRSDEAIAALAAAANLQTDDFLGVTQPVRLIEEDSPQREPDQSESESPAESRSRSRRGRAAHQSTGSEEQALRRKSADARGAVKRARLRDIGQRSWDAIVAFEKAAPVVKRKPRPQPKQQYVVTESDEVRAHQAIDLGYATRPAADPAWDRCRLGLSLTCWAGMAGGLLMFLTWLVPAVPLFVRSMRMAGSVFAPFQDIANVSAGQSFQFGIQMVILGVLPIIFCLAVREIAPLLFLATLVAVLVGLVLGQVVRPQNAGLLFLFCGIMQTGIVVTCAAMFGGLCLICFVPRRSSLTVRSVVAAGSAFVAIVAVAAVALAHIKQAPGLSVPVGRPPNALLEIGLIVTGVAAPIAILMLLRGIGGYLNDRSLVESIDTCQVCVVTAAALAIGAWFAAVSGAVAGNWADVFLIVSAAGGNLAFIWIAQSAGFTRSALR
jgi:FHA domain